jgi:hypothetical protein
MSYGPKDLFDTLLALDWAGRFESFNADELRRLELYDSLAVELGERPFFAQPQVLTLKAGPDGSSQDLQHAGEDPLRSMAMTFRQLWMTGEPAEFQGVRGMLRKRAKSPRDRVDVVVPLDELGRRYRDATREVRMKDVDRADPFGEPLRVHRARQVIDDWLYSGPFHTEPARVQRVQAWSRPGYEWALVESINEIASVMWELHLVVRGALAASSTAAAA